MDTTGFQFYPQDPAQTDQTGQQSDKYSFGDSVFMGANTPGR